MCVFQSNPNTQAFHTKAHKEESNRYKNYFIHNLLWFDCASQSHGLQKASCLIVFGIPYECMPFKSGGFDHLLKSIFTANINPKLYATFVN